MQPLRRQPPNLSAARRRPRSSAWAVGSPAVYAAPDPKAGAAGTLYDIPSDKRLNHTFPTVRGVLEADSVALLRAFFKERRRGR